MVPTIHQEKDFNTDGMLAFNTPKVTGRCGWRDCTTGALKKTKTQNFTF
jgi:hypothetical protein